MRDLSSPAKNRHRNRGNRKGIDMKAINSEQEKQTRSSSVKLTRDQADVLQDVIEGMSILGKTRGQAIYEASYINGVSEEWIIDQFKRLGK